MNPRWAFAAIASLVTLASASAQPVAVAPMAGPDPYAIVGSPTSGLWFENGLVVPTTDSLRDRFWFRLEYLGWGTEGMDLPALVTTSPSGTPQIQAGVLGQSGTRVLFGASEINGGSVSGARWRSGFWVRDGNLGFETEYFGLGKQSDGYAAGSDGSTILARPYFDALNGRQAAQLFSYPNLASGNISISSKSELRSFLINGRVAMVPVNGAVCADACNPSDRIDWIVGYRALELRDRLGVGESFTTQTQTVGVSEAFETKNKFGGLQLGVVYQANFRRAWLESMIRVAVGQNRQSVDITGNTSITDSGVTQGYTGGLLAQRTNIGHYQRKQFAMVPELGLTAGFRVTSCMRATIGYTVVYFPSVVRPGDQIDTDVNPNLVPPESTPFVGPLRPGFSYVESDYWAQGINLGAEFVF